MNSPERNTPSQQISRIVLGAMLAFAGTSHLTWARTAFRAQVPPWLPLNVDLVVVLSGIVEIALGCALLFLTRQRVGVGWIVAAFFVCVFPGNIAQLTEHRNAFGLNSDVERTIRLFFQPVLVIWTLWCTGAWRALRSG